VRSAAARLCEVARDFSESNDLSVVRPEIVAELGNKIDGFLQKAGALVPIPNSPVLRKVD